MGEAWRRRFCRLVLLLGAMLLLAPAVAMAQTVDESFADQHIAVGGTTTLTFTITNPDAPTPHAVSFDDTLPAGLQVSGTPSTDCLTGIASSSGPSDISFNDPAVAEASCTVTATVQGVQAGQWENPVTVTIDTTTSDITASVNVDAPPTISMAFGQSPLPVNQSTMLTFTLANPSANPDAATGVAFDDTLPAGLSVATGTATACGLGTVTTTAPNSISLSGADIAAGDQCQFSVPVTGVAPGAYIHATGQVSSNEGGAGSAASAQINVDAPPTLAASFSPNDIRPGGTTTLTVTIASPAENPDDATVVGFGETLPAGLTVASSGPTQTCNGNLTTTSPGQIDLSGATATAGQPCQFSVTVTGAADGFYATPIGGASSSEGGSGAPAAAPLTVAAPPSLAQAFGAGAIGAGGTTSLTFTITNPNASATLTGIGFADSLSPELTVAGPNALADTCGGAASAPTGGSVISLNGAQLGPGSTCTVSVRVLGSQAGRFASTSGAVGSTEGGGGNATAASLTIIGSPRVTVTSPTPGATYRFGQKVHAGYSCVDDPNGPGISSCKGDVPNGGLIDTSKAGLHIFTITAMSKDGGNSSDLVFYTVGPNSRFKILDTRVRPNGTVDFRVKLPGPGRVDVLETVARAAAAALKPLAPGHGQLAPGHGEVVFARGREQAKRAVTLHLVVKPNPRGRRALQHDRRLRVAVAVRYTPKGGTARILHFTFRVP